MASSAPPAIDRKLIGSGRRTRETDKAAGLATVPREALCFDVGPFELAKGDAKDGKMPIRMRARSGQPIEHWYWGKVVHDMAGFRAAAPTIPVDYCHFYDEVLGYLNEFKAAPEGLDVAGELVSFRDGDRTSEVVHKARAGVPYQSSIYFSDQDMLLEEVPPKFSVQVNGYTLQGPALVIRQWTLRGVAVCPYGYDPNTSTKLAADQAGDVPVHFVTPGEEPTAMSKETKPAETTETTRPATELTPPNPATPAGSSATGGGAPAGDPRAEFKATLAKFTEKFGAENGAKWAAEGLSYEQALEKHAEALASQLTAKDKEAADAKAKLAAIPRGEAEPVSLSDATGKDAAAPDVAQLKNRIGENLARFAAGIKLPSRK